MKKALLIIAHEDFRDEEYFETKEVLESHGIKVATASDKKGNALGAYGGETQASLSLEEIDPDKYDAIVFIGGAGASRYLDNEKLYGLINKIGGEKVIGAICVAPTILAKSGILKGKACTVWSSNMDKSCIRIVEEHGGKCRDEKIIKDGNVITANGPAASQEFGLALAEALTEKEK